MLTYTCGCVTKHFNDFNVLFVGRIFSGVATSLLYSAFESWLVAEHKKVLICFERFSLFCLRALIHTEQGPHKADPLGSSLCNYLPMPPCPVSRRCKRLSRGGILVVLGSVFDRLGLSWALLLE